MAVISEKIQHATPFDLKFYKEGAFWVAYEQSAYWVWQHKAYKVSKKFVKSIAREVLSIGFPQSVMLHLLSVLSADASVLSQSHHLNVTLPQAIDLQAFEEWKAGVALKAPSAPSRDKACLLTKDADAMEFLPSKDNDLAARIISFPLAHRTPMDAFLFVKELQDSIVK